MTTQQSTTSLPFSEVAVFSSPLPTCGKPVLSLTADTDESVVEHMPTAKLNRQQAVTC